MTTRRRFVQVLGARALSPLVLLVGAARAESTAWKFDGTDDVPAVDAARFSDAANWTAGVPSGASWTVAMTGAAGSRFVSLDVDATVASLSGTFAETGRVYLYGDRPLTFDNGTARARVGAVCLYAPVRVARDLMALTDMNFCGDVSGGTLTVSGDRVRHRLDCYAPAEGGDRRNFGPVGVWYLGSGSLIVQAPTGSTSGETGAWSQTAGSPFVFRTGAAHPIPVGARVQGDGLVPGTFVKRVFTDAIVELSQPVSTTVEGNALAFAPIVQNAHQRIQTLRRGGNALNDRLCLQKARAEDDLRVEADRVTSTSDTAVYLTLDSETGNLPGTLVLHDVTACTLALRLKTCSLEFAETPEGKTAGAPTSTVFMDAATDVATLTVTGGVQAALAVVSNLVGRLEKRGAGSLTATLVGDCAANTGTLAVREGTFCVGGGACGVRTLSLGANATLELAAAEVACEAFAAEAGARVTGRGTLVLPPGTDLSSVRAAFESGVSVRVAGGVGAVVLEPPAAQRPDEVGVPALWMDFSATNRMDLVEEDGVWRVRKVRDVRDGETYPFATNVVLSPIWTPDAQDGRGHVFFEYMPDAGTDIAKTQTLVWDRPLSGIRAVFVVKDPIAKGGQLLGSTDRLPGVGHFMRPGGWNWNQPLFYENNNTEGAKNVKNGAFYVNGEVANWRNGHPYAGGWSYGDAYHPIPVLIECDPTGGGASADCFAFEHSATERQAHQRLCECVVFTNELSQVQRQAVTRYLMNKWMGAEVTYRRGPASGAGFGTLDTAQFGDVTVAAGEVAWADAVSGGGVLVKRGAGALYLEDAVDAAGGLDVREGVVSLGSGLSAAEAGAGAYLHVDASAAASLVCDRTEDETRVISWADRRGAGHPVAQTFAGTTNFPALRAVAELRGRCAVDFGPLLAKPSDPPWSQMNAATSMAFAPTQGLQTVVLVMGSRQGGGSLVGGDVAHPGNDSYNSDYGLFRGGDSHGAQASDPLLSTAAGRWTGLRQAGAYRASVNGTAVDVTKDGLSGGWDIVSYASIGSFGAGGFAGNHYNHYCGGQEIAEAIFYPRMLSTNEIARVEAYLRAKWFGVETPGCRPAVLASASIAAGASLEVRGNPLTVSSLSGAGTVKGDLTVVAGGTLDVSVGADGSVPCLTVTGTADLAAGGTVRLRGNLRHLAAGDYDLVSAGNLRIDLAGWTLSLEKGGGSRDFLLRAVGGRLVLRVQPRGLAVIVR